MRSNTENEPETGDPWAPLPGNRAALESRHVEAWRRILAGLPASPCPSVEATARGLTLQIAGRSLEGALDPGGSADLLVAGAKVSDVAQVVVFGFGSGHVPRATLRAVDSDSRVSVVVIDPGAFIAALSNLDVRDVLEDPRLELLVGDVRELASAMPTGDAEMAVVVCEPLLEAAAPSLQPLTDMARELAVVQSSLRRQMRDILENVEGNLDVISTAPPVGALEATLAGRSVMLIAPGPSLDGQLSLLASRPLPPVVALDTALRPLCRAGVRPDLVVTLDPTRGNLAKFVDVSMDLPLVFFAGARPEVVTQSSRPFFACEAEGILDEAHPWFGRGGVFRSRGSVLLAALDVLLAAKAEPVVLVGADLAFGGGRSHAELAASGTRPVTSRTVPGRKGGTVETSESLWRHWRRLNRCLEQLRPGRVLDATSHGAEIRAPRVELGAWLSTLPADQLTPPAWPQPHSTSPAEREAANQAARRAIAKERERTIARPQEREEGAWPKS